MPIVRLIIVYVCTGIAGYTLINDCGFRCRNGECIAGELLCDGRTDCSDSSDETVAECTKPEILCSKYAFRCNYGGCINGDYVCNGIQDCVDNSDELQLQCIRNITNIQIGRPIHKCEADQFVCDNGQCIYSIDVCDGTRNCIDGSDEKMRLCRRVTRSTVTKTSVNELDMSSVLQKSDPFNKAVIPYPFPCRAPPQPQNGQWIISPHYGYAHANYDYPRECLGNKETCKVPEATNLTFGTVLIYTCNSGYKISSSIIPTNVVQTGVAVMCNWVIYRQYGLNIIPNCIEIYCKVLTTASIKARCTYDDEPTLCETSVPGTKAILDCQNGYHLEINPLYAQGNTVICNTSGEWEPEPMRCVSEIHCKILTTASIEANCTYDDESTSCETSVPGTIATLGCQNGYRLEINPLYAQGNTMICNASGKWEPELIRCIPECGTPPDIKPAIVNGVRPTFAEFPWHVSLYRDKSDKTKEYFCGASIIQERFLITAAHCVYDENIGQIIDASKIYVLVGNSFRDYDSTLHNRNLVKQNQVKYIYIIRNYLGFIGNYLGDIAILELVTPFVFSTWLVPVCIDTVLDKNVTELVGSYGKVAGFGRTAHGETSAILQSLTMPVIPLSQCISATQSANTRQFVNDKFCAGYRNGSSICDGDSGGGLVFKTNNLWYLRGIVSLSAGTIQDGGTARCDNYLYSLYTNVSRHVLWIQEVISKVEQNQRHALCSNESETACA